MYIIYNKLFITLGISNTINGAAELVAAENIAEMQRFLDNSAKISSATLNKWVVAEILPEKRWNIRSLPTITISDSNLSIDTLTKIQSTTASFNSLLSDLHSRQLKIQQFQQQNPLWVNPISYKRDQQVKDNEIAKRWNVLARPIPPPLLPKSTLN